MYSYPWAVVHSFVLLVIPCLFSSCSAFVLFIALAKALGGVIIRVEG